MMVFSILTFIENRHTRYRRGAVDNNQDSPNPTVNKGEWCKPGRFSHSGYGELRS